MIKRTILVPMDGSEFSRQIVPYVCRLCDPDADTIVLLRVSEPVESIIGAPPRSVSMAWMEPFYTSARDLEYAQHPIFASQLEQNEKSALEQELAGEALRLRAVGFKVSIDVRFGEPASEVAAADQHHKADFIAMATHGRTGLRQLLMGSVAEKVMRRVNVPVLLLRPFRFEGD